VGAEFFHADRRMDGYDKANRRFENREHSFLGFVSPCVIIN
jgi:hypothetical protein